MTFEGIDGDGDVVIVLSGCRLCRKASLASLRGRLAERTQPEQLRQAISSCVQERHTGQRCCALPHDIHNGVNILVHLHVHMHLEEDGRKSNTSWSSYTLEHVICLSNVTAAAVE